MSSRKPSPRRFQVDGDISAWSLTEVKAVVNQAGLERQHPYWEKICEFDERNSDFPLLAKAESNI